MFVYLCALVYVCARVCVFVYVFAYVCALVCVCVRVCVHACICMYVCVRVCICVLFAILIRKPILHIPVSSVNIKTSPPAPHTGLLMDYY